MYLLPLSENFLKELQLNALEWRLDTAERQLADYEKRFSDLHTSIQNTASLLVEICQRLNALERGTILGMTTPFVSRSTPHYAYWPRGHGPNKSA